MLIWRFGFVGLAVAEVGGLLLVLLEAVGFRVLVVFWLIVLLLDFLTWFLLV